MKVFISWSGETSKALGEAFTAWLPSVLQAVKCYFSPDDVAKGSRWNSEIGKELEASQVGLLCLTIDNLEAPWLMFEAGALSKNLDKSRVCPILFGVEPTDLKGPLVAFQACRFDRAEIKKVVAMIDHELGERAILPAVLGNVFDKWWPDLENSVTSILSEIPKATKQGIRSDREILEEVLELNRSFSKRQRSSEYHRDAAESVSPSRRRKIRQLHPMSLEEVSDVFAENAHQDIGVVVLASIFREELPWLYELLMETYRFVNLGRYKKAKELIAVIHRLLECGSHGSMRDIIGITSRNERIAIHDALQIMDAILERHAVSRKSGMSR